MSRTLYVRVPVIIEAEVFPRFGGIVYFSVTLVPIKPQTSSATHQLSAQPIIMFKRSLLATSFGAAGSSNRAYAS